MAERRVEALEREATSLANTYKQLETETRSLISSQKGLLKALGLKRTSIIGSVAYGVAEVREQLKLNQLKKQQQSMLQAQLDVAKRKADLDRREMQLRARQYDALNTEYRSLASRRAARGGMLPVADENRFQQLQRERRVAQTSAARAATKYEKSAATEQGLASEVGALAGGAGKLAGAAAGIGGGIISSIVGIVAGALGGPIAGIIANMVTQTVVGFVKAVIGTIIKVVGAVIGVVVKALSSAISFAVDSIKKLGTALLQLYNGIKQTQKDFGFTMSQAAAFQADIFASSVKNMIATFKSLDFRGFGDFLKDTASNLFNIGRDLTKIPFAPDSQNPMDLLKNVGLDAFDKLKDLGRRLTEERPTAPGAAERETAIRYVEAEERINVAKALQAEFGTFSKGTRDSLARFAAERGLTAEAVVQARRVFATQTLGDYRKALDVQNKFMATFQRAGMTPKVALEVAIKNSELLARNGTRFADSFARAAADAKALGVDLQKVDQFGDSIVNDYEGFLEGFAELGALGFDLDSSRIMAASISGDTGELYRELTSQLARTGKDLNNLNRIERSRLETVIGMPISELLRSVSGKPAAATQEELQGQTNSYLQNILAMLSTGGDILKFLNGPMGELAKFALAVTVGGALYQLFLQIKEILSAKFTELINAVKQLKLFGDVPPTKDEVEAEAKKLLSQNKFYAGRQLLRQSGMFTGQEVENLSEPYFRPQTANIRAGKIPGASITESNKFRFDPTTGDAAYIENFLKGRFREYTPIGATQADVRADQLRREGLSPTEIVTRLRQEGVPGYVDGGLVTGLGTGTSDSIPARLSNGEYVVKASAVKKLGVEKLDQMNREAGDAKLAMDVANAVIQSDAIKTFTGPFGDSFKYGQLGSAVLRDSMKGDYKQVGSDVTDFAKGEALDATVMAALTYGAGMTASTAALPAMALTAAINDMKDTYQRRAQYPWNKGKPWQAWTEVDPKAKTGQGKTWMDRPGSAIYNLYNNRTPSQQSNRAQQLDPVIVTASRNKMHTGGIVGDIASDEVPTMLQKGEAVVSKLQFGNLNQIVDNINMLATQATVQPTSPSPTTQQIKVDISNLEQKFDQLVGALSNIEVNMDGNKVGNLLVNATRMSSNFGVMRSQNIPSF